MDRVVRTITDEDGLMRAVMLTLRTKNKDAEKNLMRPILELVVLVLNGNVRFLNGEPSGPKRYCNKL